MIGDRDGRVGGKSGGGGGVGVEGREEVRVQREHTQHTTRTAARVSGSRTTASAGRRRRSEGTATEQTE